MENSFGKVVFQIFTEIEMSWNENRLLGRHFETKSVFFFWGGGIFCLNKVAFSV